MDDHRQNHSRESLNHNHSTGSVGDLNSGPTEYTMGVGDEGGGRAGVGGGHRSASLYMYVCRHVYVNIYIYVYIYKYICIYSYATPLQNLPRSLLLYFLDYVTTPLRKEALLKSVGCSLF